MVNSMVEGTVSTLQMWEEKVKQGGGVAEFDVQPDVHAISGKIISLAAFSNDFETGRQIYENQKSIIEIVFKSLGSLLFYIPGSRYAIYSSLYLGYKLQGNENEKIEWYLSTTCNGSKARRESDEQRAVENCAGSFQRNRTKR